MPGQVIDLAVYRGTRRSVRESTVDIAPLPWLWATWAAFSTLAWWAVPAACPGGERPCHGAAPLLARDSSDDKLPRRPWRPIDDTRGSIVDLAVLSE